MVDEPVRDARLGRDVADPRAVEALRREDADGRLEQDLALLLVDRPVSQVRPSIERRLPPVQPLGGMLVVDLSRYLPGAYATRELLELGARVVRLEPPDGDPMRFTAPAWHDALNAGKESVACDLKADPALGRALVRRADVVVESFRPGVAARLGVGPEDAAPTAVYCSITGFGLGGPHEQRAGHDLNYVGWAGLLADTAPGLPPLPLADLASGALDAVGRILAALLVRERTGEGCARRRVDDARRAPAGLAPARRRAARPPPHRARSPATGSTRAPTGGT